MIIERIAKLPKNIDLWPEVFRYMVQSMSHEEQHTMDFIVDLWSFYNRNGYLSDGQHQAAIKIFQRFVKSVSVQFPEEFKKSCFEKSMKKGNFTVYEGGKNEF